LGISEKELEPGHIFAKEERRVLAQAIKKLDPPLLKASFVAAKTALVGATPLTPIEVTKPLYATTDASSVR
jgi:hypothetical protein